MAITSIKKHASCNVNMEIRFIPDPNNPSDATVQTGTTVIVVTKQPGNIQTTTRSVGSASLSGYPISIKTIYGPVEETEVTCIDRLAPTTEGVIIS